MLVASEGGAIQLMIWKSRPPQTFLRGVSYVETSDEKARTECEISSIRFW